MKATQSTFSGLEITKTRKVFEVKNSTDLVESFLNLYGLQNSKPTVNPGRRSAVMELASSTPGWSRLLQLSHRGRKTPLHGTMETRHAIRHPTTMHTSPQSHDREQARSETVDTIPQRHATHRAKRFKQVCWNSCTPKCYGISLRCTERDNVQPKSEADCNQSHLL